MTLGSPRHKPLLQPQDAFKWTLVVAFVLYAFQLTYRYVGYFGDDAAYILGAQSLLQGDYISLAHPSQIPLTQFPPGYSLFLIPFVKLFAPHWAWIKLTSIVLMLLNTTLLWNLLKGMTTPWMRVCLCGLFAFNPTTQRLSAVVLSEPLFLCLSLLSFLLLRETLRARPVAGAPMLLGIVVGYVAIVRTIGIVLIPALIVALVCSKRWRVLAQTVPLMILPEAVVALNNLHLTGHLTTHVGLLFDMLGYLFTNGLSAWLDHLHRMGNLYLVRALLDIQLPLNAWGIAANVLLFVPLLICAGVGIKKLWQSSALPRAVTSAMVLYFLGYLGVYSFWFALDLRFVFPVLPFLLLWILEGLRQISSALPQQRRILGILGLLVLGSYAHASIQMLMNSTHSDSKSRNSLPQETYAWIRERLPKTACLLSTRTSTHYLYTQRKGLPSINATDIEDFRYHALKNNITHVISQPHFLIGVRKAYSPGAANVLWVGSWPAAFPELYRNDHEQTLIYDVSKNPSFVKAYELYLLAQRSLADSKNEQGKQQLEQALRIHPQLACAQNAYGAVLMIQGHSPSVALSHFQKAIELRPFYPLALLNLARFHKDRKRLDLARDSYQKALQAIPLSGEEPVLAPVIQQELAAL